MTARRPRASPARGYKAVLAEVTQNIATARHRALPAVNAGLVGIYWDIGRIVVRQQETARWGDAIVESLAKDLRAGFPDMSGLTRDNLFRMRQFFLVCREIDAWLGTGAPLDKVGTVCRQLRGVDGAAEIVGTLSRQFASPILTLDTRWMESSTVGCT